MTLSSFSALVSVVWSKEEIHRPADVGLCGLVYSRSYAFAVGGLLSFSVGDLESRITPQSLDALPIHRPAFFIRLAMGSLITPPGMLQGEGPQPGGEVLIGWRWDWYRQTLGGA